MPDDRSIKPDLAEAIEHINKAAVILSKCAAGRLAGVIGRERSQERDIGAGVSRANQALASSAAALIKAADDLHPLTDSIAEY